MNTHMQQLFRLFPSMHTHTHACAYPHVHEHEPHTNTCAPSASRSSCIDWHPAHARMILIIVPSTARITHLCLYSFFSARSYLSNADCPCLLLEKEPTFFCPSLLILYDSVWGFTEIGMFVYKRSTQLLTHWRSLAPGNGIIRERLISLRCWDASLCEWCVCTTVWDMWICRICASESTLYVWFVCVYKCGAYACICVLCL